VSAAALAPFSGGSASNAKIIDLSVPVDPDAWEPTPVKRVVIGHREGADLLGESYSLTRKSRLGRLYEVARSRLGFGVNHRDFPDKKGLSLMTYTLTTHTGTHMDAPYHYGDLNSQGQPARTICQVPLDWCFGDGVRLDLRGNGRTGVITVEELEEAVAQTGGDIKPRDIVLIWTGADAHVGKPEYFSRFRGMTRAATQWLVERGVRVIGIDSFGFDAPFTEMLDNYFRSGAPSDLWPAHLYGREREYCQLERLAGLGAIGRARGFKVACFPVHLRGADAAWSRVVAIVEEELPTCE
jgi:kynurenine formamidase